MLQKLRRPLNWKHLGLHKTGTRPFTPKTNGKTERFIKTNVTELAYATAYSTSDQRAAAIPIWITMHNRPRPHADLKIKL